MSERDEKARILTMLEEGKITADEATRLFLALRSASSVDVDGALERLATAFGRRVRTGDGPTRTETHTGRFGPGPVTVKVSNANGRVSIGTCDGDEFRAEIEYPEDDRTPCTVVADETSLTITSDRDTFGSSSVRIRLDLPADRHYDMATELINGRVSARDLTCGQFEIKVGNGKIEATDCRCERGALKARNGGISARVAARELKASSNTGRVDLLPDPAVSGRYQLTTGVGKIEVELKERDHTGYRVNCTSELGKVSVRLPGVREDRRGMGNDVTAQTPGYDQAEVKIEIDAASRVGKIDIETK